jgi:hypothetical protein
VSLALILFLAGVLYLSTRIPQRIDAAPIQLEMWRFRHTGLLRVVDFFNLHSIYAQPWFAVIILGAALTLAVSSRDQLRIARKKLSSIAVTPADEITGEVSGDLLRRVARSHGYHLLGSSPDGQLKFVRNPWGYFGNPLLHTGIAFVIMMSLYVALTTRQAALILVEGEQHSSGQQWAISEQGLFAKPLKFPGSIRLDKVSMRFDDKQQPVDVVSDLTISDSSGRIDSLSASINRIVSYRGLRIYHATQYGNAFAVSFTGKDGAVHTETIAAHHPASPSEAGYSDEFGVEWTLELLSAKYYADVNRKSLSGDNPELTLRATRGGAEVARTTLTKGASGAFGAYQAHLNGVSRWAKLIIVDCSGMPLVFTGFAVIMLGGLLQYLAPPRELIAVRQQHDRYTVFWKATSFREFFIEERDIITAGLEKEATA